MKQKKTPEKLTRCVCEDPGHFSSGVPGILVCVEKRRIISRVERCDACRRFRDDQVAESVLRRILKTSAPHPRGRAKTYLPQRK
jgi:hypothetical protein